MGGAFDCLTEIAADGSLVGELAESWESTDGSEDLDLQPAQGRRIPQRQELRCRRRDRIPADARCGGSKVTGQAACRAHRRNEEDERSPGPVRPSGRRRRLPVPAVGLPHPDLPGGHGRRVNSRRDWHRRVPQRGIRSRRAPPPRPQSERVQGSLVRPRWRRSPSPIPGHASTP